MDVSDIVSEAASANESLPCEMATLFLFSDLPQSNPQAFSSCSGEMFKPNPRTAGNLWWDSMPCRDEEGKTASIIVQPFSLAAADLAVHFEYNNDHYSEEDDEDEDEDDNDDEDEEEDDDDYSDPDDYNEEDEEDSSSESSDDDAGPVVGPPPPPLESES